MDKEETNSNSDSTILFGNDYCLVTSDGILRQKNNLFFEGKELKKELADSFEEHIKPYEDAFSAFESQLMEKYESRDSISEEEWDEILSQAKSVKAVGDFESVLTTLKAKVQPVSKEKEEPEPVDSEAATEESDETISEPDTESQEAAEAESNETADTPESYYENLKIEAEKAADSNNFSNGLKTIDNILAKWNEGPEADTAVKDSLRHKVEKAKEKLIESKAEYEKKQEDRKVKNFQRREELLAKLQQIIDKKRWQSQNQVSNIQRKFESLKPLPKDGIEDQNEKLRELVAVFDENRIQYLVSVRLKEEDNFTGKLVTVEKIESLTPKKDPESADWQALGKEFDELLRQWKKIGRVPMEKEAELQEKLDKAINSFIEKRLEYDNDYKKEISKLKKRHEKLIKRAESLSETDDLVFASREINRLHSEWKKLENLPQKLNDEYWDRFKQASDAFNKIRDDNANLIKEQEEKNIQVKLDLIKKAQEVAEKADFKTGNNQLDKLLTQWKESGPVMGKKSRKLWRDFRKAMDAYYNQRRKHFEVIKKEQEENLNKKKDIIATIKEAATAEQPENALKDIQKLQDEFKQIGFVPIKQKDKIWKAYRAACDAFYDSLRSKGSGNVKGSRFEDRLDKEVTSELFRLRKESDKIREQIMKYKDNMTYFKPNKKGLELRAEIQHNIDTAEKELEAKASRINELQKKLEEIHE